MLARDRISSIMEMIRENKSVLVSDLSSRFKVTDETIRRDLEKLEAQKLIIRVHGGAYLFEGFEKGAPVSLRKQFLISEKERISYKCLEFIENKDTIMLDSSTISLYIAKALKSSHFQVTVISNYLDIINELADVDSIKLLAIGGTYNISSRCFSGPATIEALEAYNADKAFVSCSSIDSKLNLTAHNENDGHIRGHMLNNSAKKFLVIDHTKFDKASTYKFGELKDVDYIIMDKAPGSEWSKRIKNAGVVSIYA